MVSSLFVPFAYGTLIRILSWKMVWLGAC